MVFYFLITIVFIAELIIAGTILINLFKWSKIFKATNEFLTEANPKIKDIMEIGEKISEQMVEFSPIIVEKFKIFSLKFLLDNLKGFMAGILLLSLKRKFKIKRIRGLKFLRLISAFCFE